MWSCSGWRLLQVLLPLLLTASRTSAAPTLPDGLLEHVGRHLSDQYAKQLQRRLAVGDFERFNELFADAELALPDAELGNGGASLDLTNIYCGDLLVGDIQTSYSVYQENGKDILAFNIVADPFAMECYADFRYRLLFIPGDGTVRIDTSDNRLSTRVLIESASTFANEPPLSSRVAFCDTKIETYGRVNFSGDWLGEIIELFSEPVSNLIEDEASSAVCNEFQVLGPDMFGNLLNQTKNLMEEWMKEPAPEVGDPLYPEKNFNNTDNVKLIDFRANSSASIGDLFVSILKEENAIFGGAEMDPVTGELDLAINGFLRDSFLGDDGTLRLLVGETESFDALVFAGHDALTQTNILIDGIALQGLDTLQTFSAFRDIGNYTIENEFKWDTLSLEVNLTIDMKPSSLPNSLIRSSREISIVENVTISLDLYGLDVNLALFMAIDQGKLDALKLGSLLDSSNILPCLLSSMVEFEVSGLNVSVADLSVPNMTGFISPGIDRIISDIAEAAFVAFEPTMLKAMPGFFQGPVRDILKSRVLADYIDTVGGCPEPNPQATGPLDFRDLFLAPNESVALGGSGSRPYGDIGALAYDLIQDRFVGAGADGLPGINEMVIRPMTEEQSGTPGLLRFPDTIFSISSETLRRRLSDNIFANLGGGLNTSIGDIRISNIDSIVPPLELLGITSDAAVLRNDLGMASGTTGPLSLTMKLSSGQEGELNEVDISASIDSLTLLANVKALMDAQTFLQFPLGDMLDFNCWLAALPSVELNNEGFPVDPSATRGLSLSAFRSALSSLTLTSDCIKCESAGMELLPELFQILDQTGSVTLLGTRLPAILDSVVTSDTTQTMMERLIVSGSKSCPSSSLYDANFESPGYSFVGLPTFSGDTIDTVLFSGVLAAEMAFVVFAETERAKGVPETDPLSTQNAFVPPEGVRLLDWTNFGNATGFGGLADQVFGQVRQFLGGDDQNFLDFEAILEGLLDENGVLVLETGISFEEGDFLLSLESVRIAGFDDFALNEVFEPIAPQTLFTSAEFKELNVEFVLVADAPSTSEPPQRLTVEFSVQDLSFDIALFLAFDLDKVGMLQLGSLLDTGSIFGCIMSAALEFDIPQLKVSIGSFTDPEIGGLLADTQAVASQATSTIFNQYRSQITEAIPILFDGVVKDAVAGFLDATDSSSCKQLDSILPTAFIDFRDLMLSETESVVLGGSGKAPYGDLLSKAFDFLKKEIFVEDEGTGLSVVNEQFINEFTDPEAPGSLSFPGDVFNEGTRVSAGGLDALVRLRLHDVYVRNIDTIGVPVTLLDPVNGEAHQLNNSLTIGVNDPLTLGARFYIQIVVDDADIENDVDISISLDTLNVLLTAFGKVSERSFMGFPIQDITNLQCWLATIPAPDLDARGVLMEQKEAVLSILTFLAQVDKLGLNITCYQCTGPGLEEFSKLLDEGNDSEAFTDFANGLFDFLNELVEGQFLQVIIDRALNDAPKKCPHRLEYDPEFEKNKYAPFETRQADDSFTFFIAVIVVVAVAVAICLAIVLTTKVIVRRRHRRWVEGLSKRQVNLLLTDQHAEDGKQKQLNEATVSMFFSSDAIPAWVRFSMPMIILGNIAFFLSGHLNLGASVTILASLAGQDFAEEGFFEFSMARSTIEIWKAGGRELAILIFMFSFLWPYSKQLITMGLWFAPTNVVSVSRRGSALLWLDALAKWSMIDIFVLVITIVSFRVSVESPNVDFMPPDFYSLDLLVVPKWGLYANMIAQIISQVSSHFIIHYHRRIVEVAKGESARRPGEFPKTHTVLLDEGGSSESGRSSPPMTVSQKPSEVEHEPESLYRHAFFRPHRGQSDKLVVRQMVNPLLLFLSSTMCVLVIVGCALPSYSLDVLGVVGVLVEAGQSFVEAKTEYSVFTTIGLLLEQARTTGGVGDYLGLGTLSVLLVLTVLVVPVLQSAVLLVQWFLPVERKRRYRLSVLLEILQAWQYSEVYLLSILVGSWQLGPISEFLVNPYCSSVNGYLAEAAYYGIIKDEDAQCFKANVAVEPTFYVLLTGAILLAIVNSFVMKALTHYFHDKEGSLVIVAFKKAEATHIDDLDAHEAEQSAEGTNDRKAIHPVPVLFTDRFRWLLSRKDAMDSRQSSKSSASLPSLEQVESSQSWPEDEPRPQDFALQCLSAPEQSGVDEGDGDHELRACFSAPENAVHVRQADVKEEEIDIQNCFSAPEQVGPSDEVGQDQLVSNQSWPLASPQSDLSVSRRSETKDFTLVDL